MNSWRLLPLEVRNGYWNMALDEAILKSVIEMKSPNTVRFYKWNPSTVSLGQNQSLSEEVDVKVVNEMNFNIVRRITGGGAVFHDKNCEITYSIVCPIEFLEELNAYSVLAQFEIITQCIIASLIDFGLTPEKGVIHCPAIFIEGKKFSGNAQIRKMGHLLQHGTILLDIDPELMYSVLKAPYNVSKSKMVKSVYSKCIGLKEVLQNYNEKKFLSALKCGFENTLGIKLEKGSFSDYELEIAESLVEEKYTQIDWLKKYE